MKILYFESTGYCIWTKRLEQGQFNYKAAGQDKQALDVTRLQWLLEDRGAKISAVQALYAC
ncbi:MAG: IS66 family insertion sequence element accessory protein TnpB [Hahellaceae bacterium]|nr:IS66 family insertion sequence element accessory protein TnpB [Hahellaceae bacterium]